MPIIHPTPRELEVVVDHDANRVTVSEIQTFKTGMAYVGGIPIPLDGDTTITLSVDSPIVAGLDRLK